MATATNTKDYKSANKNYKVPTKNTKNTKMATTTNTKDYKSANKNYKVTTNQIKNGNNQKLKLKSIGCMGELEQPGNSRE